MIIARLLLERGASKNAKDEVRAICLARADTLRDERTVRLLQ